MNSKESIIIVILIIIFLTLTVSAVDKSASIRKEINQENGTIGNYSIGDLAANVSAEGGNTSSLNLSLSTTTYRWQGYIGTVGGNFYLGSESNILANIGSIQKSQIKTVFASTDNNFDFSNLEAANGTLVDTAWGWDDSGDNGTIVFSGTNFAAISDVENVPIINLSSFYADGTQNNHTFYTGVFNDSAIVAGGYDNLAFGAIINASQGSFLNVPTDLVDYEMIVPVNITNTGGPSSQTYYFFLDIE